MSGSPSEQTSLVRPEGPGASQSARLILAISQGNRDAEREFAECYMPPVRAMMMARLRDPDLASDLKQDVMIEALCALRKGQVQDPEKLSQFVYGIARNCLNNHFRSSRRAISVELPEELPDLSDNTEQREQHDREQSALRAIESLDRLDRVILQMTLVDGLKPGAIADQLRLSPDVVRQRKLRATRRVTEFIRGQSQKSVVAHIDAGGPK